MMKKSYNLRRILLVVWSLAVGCVWAAENGPALTPEEVERHARIGYAALGANDMVLAGQHLEQAAAGGDVRSQVRLGMLFDAAEEDEAAAYWFGLAAESGDIEGKLKLAELYAKGEGVEQDFAKSLALVQEIAEEGYAPAQYQMGLLFEHGSWGVTPDPVLAYRWYQKAADQEHFFSVDRLYRAHRDGELGMVPAPEQTAAWKQRREASRESAERERKRAQAELLELVRSVGLWGLPEPAEGAAASQGGAQ